MFSKLSIKNLFSKRKPNHLIVYVVFNNKEKLLYKILSKLTYSVGPFFTIDECIDGVKKFIEKYPDKLKQMNITSYGTGKFLVETTEDKSKVLELVNSLKPLMDENTKLMFTTCFSGISTRKVVEMSEELNGIEVSAMNGPYSLNGEMTKCKCGKRGYSKSVVEKLPLSKYGLINDEVKIIHVVKRNEGEEINWKTSGMAYEYNKIMFENGICRVGNQPYTLLKSIRNYLFNIQS
jgi:hypothetical protein